MSDLDSVLRTQCGMAGEEAADEIMRLNSEQDAVRQMLGNLLAVIHCDGGHYITDNGWIAALRDAEKLVGEERMLIYELREALHEIAEEWAGAECGEPKYAQEAYAIALCKRMYAIAATALESTK